MSEFAPLTAADVGRRVTVRHRLVDEHGDPALSDVLGLLESAADDVLVVRRKDNTLVAVPRANVTAVRRVPDAPAHRVGLPARSWTDEQIESISWQGWPGLEVKRLGEWVLRAAGGFTGRANSALPLGDPGCSRSAAVEAVTRFYGQRSLRPLFQVPLPLCQELDSELATLGWNARTEVDVLVADLAAVLQQSPANDSLPPVRFSRSPEAEWLAAYHYRGWPIPGHAGDVLAAGTQPVFASVIDEDQRAIAIARGALLDGWVGVTAVEVAAGQRRRGLGAHVMRELLGWAERSGARHAYLQVTTDNVDAQRLYGRMGFDRHHSYHYREAP